MPSPLFTSSRASLPGMLLLCGLVAAIGCDPSPRPAPPAAISSPSRPATPRAFVGFTPEEIKQIKQMRAPSEPPRDATNLAMHRPEAIALGHTLFFDPRLSSDQNVSCASCHRPEHGFAMPAPLGMGALQTTRHPPSLLNVAYQRWFDWDGKADSLWAQAAGPLENPREHRTSRTALARLILTDATLRDAYQAAFPEHSLPPADIAAAWPALAAPGAEDEAVAASWEALSAEERALIMTVFTNTLKAIAAYESQLVSFDAPFDRWLEAQERAERGEPAQEREAAMSEEAVRGLKHFLTTGRCVTCHNGALLSDADFHNLGLGGRDWLTPFGPDQGRADGVRKLKKSALNALGAFSDDAEGERAQWTDFLAATPEDRGQFKTPTLRNVALTAPYMHGGHFQTLPEVVRFYVKLDEQSELGHREDALRAVNLSPEQQAELVAFLEALTGAPPAAKWLAPPGHGPLP